MGGDGYLGWPTGLAFASKGSTVKLVDNFFRRTVTEKLGFPPLFAVQNMHVRAEVWQLRHRSKIQTEVGDLKNFEYLKELVSSFKPDTVIHFAEQPSAPYSMSGIEEAQFTLVNNLLGTLNLAYAVKEVDPNIHIIKLGTMGEYGTPNIDIEEGFLKIRHKDREDEFLFPRQASSLYHTTKIQDTDLLYFFVRTNGLRVTDLMQGPVYGFWVPEMKDSCELATFFNYDAVFGTVFNRFLVQAIAEIPLTVYGKGDQKRGYLNLIDTVKCIELAAKNPTQRGQLRIMNQFTEVFSVNDLADIVIEAASRIGIKATRSHIENPRKESEEHYYNPIHTRLEALGLRPTYLSSDVVVKMLERVLTRRSFVVGSAVQPTVSWS